MSIEFADPSSIPLLRRFVFVTKRSSPTIWIFLPSFLSSASNRPSPLQPSRLRLKLSDIFQQAPNSIPPCRQLFWQDLLQQGCTAFLFRHTVLWLRHQVPA